MAVLKVTCVSGTSIRSSFLAGVFFCVSAALCSGPLSHRDRLVQFFVGCYLLKSEAALDDTVRADAFRRLADVTGINPESAIRAVERYRNNPEQWAEVLRMMREQLEILSRVQE